jgi:ketosteroid isomerase-like protein
MSEHPNAALVRRGFDRFVGGADHAVAVYRAHGARDGGRSLDIEQALLIRVEDGRWVDVRAQPLDQQAFDAFWS